MLGFNPDGSLKLPGHMNQKKQEETQKMTVQRCIRVRRMVISDRPPKQCMLNIALSERFRKSDGSYDNRFVQTLYDYFREEAEVPTILTKISESEFSVEIGTAFRRCSDCQSLIGRYREFLDGNIIEEKGACSFQGLNKSWSYEDYFD